MMLLGILGFLAVGLALGMLGGGGGILAVPVLVYLLNVPPKAAVPLSLMVVGLSAAVGAYTRWKRGELRLSTVTLFAACSVAAALIAPRLGQNIPDRTRLSISIATMLLAAFAMWRRSRKTSVASTTQPASPSPLVIVPAALTAGTLTGLVGVGGGFLIVPVLNGVLGMPMPLATATSLGVIVLNTIAAGISYQGQVSIDLSLAAAIIAASMVGMVVGTRLAPKVAARTLSLAFAVLLVVVSTFMVWREFVHPLS